MRTFLLLTGFLLLFAVEILRVYFIMPFPGSQRANTLDIAYWLARNISWLRILSLLLVAYPSWQLLRQRGRKANKMALFAVIILYGVVFCMVHFKMEADVMFYQPSQKIFAGGDANKVPSDRIVVGVNLNGQAKAYPVQFIGYHHQVADTIGGEPVIVTYCTVCRTGRVFSPMVGGKKETFRLVGMDHFNAMFEDAGTRSWWRQVSGEAVTGPLKGAKLAEIPSEQLSLAAFTRKYPGALVMQPDNQFTDTYTKMLPYEQGRSKSNLTRRDSLSWQDKSWVVGIAYNGIAKAYDWNHLVQQRLIADSLPGLPLLLTLEKDSVSFHAWNRTVNNLSLRFTPGTQAATIQDIQTGSLWNMDGACIAGALRGTQLKQVQAYQEYWHSWRSFHPGTLR